MVRETLSVGQARRLALRAQGFGRRPARVGWAALRREIRRMGLLQLDAIGVLVRSHYLPLFSRLGAYPRTLFDRHAFDRPRRELFEYWGHEASLLPLDLQPLLRWRMARAERLEGVYLRVAALVRERPDFIAGVLREVRERGPLAGRELHGVGQSRGSGPWAWHDGKVALEYLFWAGLVTTAYRRGFERIYDLTERVLPAALLALPTPDEADAQRALVLHAARALGVASAGDLRDYFRLSMADTRRALAALVENGDLLTVAVEGWRQPAYLCAGLSPARAPSGGVLLTPFDPLVWERGRTERLFDFHYRIEIYVPEAQRRFGYYVLPFLLHDRLAGRVDLRAVPERATLRVLGAYIESGAERGEVADALAAELWRLAGWLGLARVEVGRRGALAAPLRAALKPGRADNTPAR